MTHLSDEILMAHADGLLDPGEKARVDRLLALDPELRARLEVFRSTGRELAHLFDERLSAPLPPKLDAFLAKHATAASPYRRSGPVWLKDRLQQLLFPEVSGFRLAAASCAMLIAGIGLGWLIHGRGAGSANALSALVQIENDRVIAGEPLRRALDALHSGDETSVAFSKGEDLRLAVKLTFRNKAQDYCREYEIALASRERYAGVACRAGGQWAVELQAAVKPSHLAPDRTAPAGGGENPAVEAAVIAMIDGDALGREDEDAIIQTGWRK